VLHFFKKSVTNDKSCIKTISEREVDGALIASMNDKEMEAGSVSGRFHDVCVCSFFFWCFMYTKLHAVGTNVSAHSTQTNQQLLEISLTFMIF